MSNKKQICKFADEMLVSHMTWIRKDHVNVLSGCLRSIHFPVLRMLLSLADSVITATQTRTDAGCDSEPQYNDRSKAD